ncbi:unnamed protein product [Durusdinium trenchii]|uniref:F-box domain-containing protein n=1 Tax=Durusdinium trenchii TaxID=1381693 RepID=A0ABP0MA13_9DINO
MASSADLPTEVLWPAHMVDKLPLQQLSQLSRVCRSLKQMCDKLVLERYQRIQTAFVDIGGGVREVLNGLPEELEDGEDARELWEIMTKVREKAKDILRLLEVTREHLEVTRSPRGLHGDVSQVLAGILDRAQQEVVRDTRSLHVEAACRFIWATRQVEELLQPTLTPRLVSGLHPACIVLHPPMNPSGEAESASSVTGQTRSRTRTSQPSFFPRDCHR